MPDMTWPAESDAAVREILRRVGTRFPGAALFLLAEHPPCLNAFSASLRDALDSCHFAEASGQVRKSADDLACAIAFSDHLARLAATGMSRETIRQIRYVAEVFFHAEPCDAVVAASALYWIEGAAGERPQPKQCAPAIPALNGRIEFVAETHLPAAATPFVQRFGTPLHALYRALAAWPDYSEMIWSELESVAASEAFTGAVGRIAACARESSRHLPSESCKADIRSRCEALASRLKRCLTASAEAALIAAALRNGFIRSEQAETS